ncbi:GNAT family N-acetyltransferase [Maribacter litopenaei]|uniref:GNAT family N-acetyltransferase n=1 Tax=Maribacter litopenaei TaxID=2976127 RepID=A0ABY5YB76_9FLAO|nr:GNAT family N-acetyltransferase [Maribacter litopenaei]UWX56320.1 GNAT family N-acetyltransferase [Maribacter litopenaei]
MDSYYISEDKSILQIDKIHSFISKAYWGEGRTLEEVKQTIHGSMCFGIYSQEHDQMGFARVVTDYIFFGYFMDVIIFEKYQGSGYGKILIEHMLDHPVIKKLKTVALKTKDAHSLYEKYGFNKIGDSPLWMSIDKQKLL